MGTEKPEENEMKGPWGVNGRPQWLQAMLQTDGAEPHTPSVAPESEQPSRVTMESEPCRQLIQSISMQDLGVLRETSTHIIPQEDSVLCNRNSEIANDIIQFKASLGAIERFVQDLAGQSKNETIHFNLARLPETWQDTFPTIRKHAIDTANSINEEFAQKLAQPSNVPDLYDRPEEAMRRLTQKVDENKKEILHELILLVHTLDKVSEALQTHLPVEALRQRAVPVINVTKEETDLLRNSPCVPTLEKVLGMGRQYASHVSPPQAILQLEELSLQLSAAASETRIACATIPKSHGVREYLNDVRNAIISRILKEETHGSALCSFLDDSEPPTLTPQTIGKLVLVANFKTGTQDDVIMKHLGIERPNKDEEAGYYAILPAESYILPATDPLRALLDDCNALDMAAIAWSKALDAIGTRMEKYENTHQTTTLAR